MKNKKKPARTKYIIPAVIIFLCIFAGLIYRAMTWEPKPDPDSEMNIRIEVAGRQYNMTGIIVDPNNLTDEDFAKVEALGLGLPQGHLISNSNPYPYCTELSDIIFLEKFTNLKSLTIGSVSYPSDRIPKWMKFLAKLGVFKLEDRLALDLSPLKKLNNLETLKMQNTRVKNIKAIGNLTNLKTLYISNVNINDISMLSNLTNLRNLSVIGFTNITDQQFEELQKALPNLKITNMNLNIKNEQVEELKKAIQDLGITIIK